MERGHRTPASLPPAGLLRGGGRSRQGGALAARPHCPRAPPPLSPAPQALSRAHGGERAQERLSSQAPSVRRSRAARDPPAGMWHPQKRRWQFPRNHAAARSRPRRLGGLGAGEAGGASAVTVACGGPCARTVRRASIAFQAFSRKFPSVSETSEPARFLPRGRFSHARNRRGLRRQLARCGPGRRRLGDSRVAPPHSAAAVSHDTSAPARGAE